MSRIPIPVTQLDRVGVEPPAQTNGDAANGHSFVNAGSRVWIEIVSTDAGDQTVDFALNVDQVDGVDVPAKTVDVPAGETVLVGNWPAGFYNQAAVTADGLLTSDGTSPANNDTVAIDGHVYTFKTALTETKAAGTLTSDATAPANNDTVTIDGHVYTFKTTLTGAADEVLIGANAAAALTNLKAAINGAAGAGSTYGTGTVAHTTVDAGTLTATTLLVTAKTTGTAGNAIATTETSAHLSWGGAVLAGGADPVVDEVLIGGSAANALTNLKAAINHAATEGTDYSTGTAAHTTVTATTLTSTTLRVVAQTTGTSGNALATSETSARLSWGASTLAGGYSSGQVVFCTPSVPTTLKFRAFAL